MRVYHTLAIFALFLLGACAVGQPYYREPPERVAPSVNKVYQDIPEIFDRTKCPVYFWADQQNVRTERGDFFRLEQSGRISCGNEARNDKTSSITPPEGPSPYRRQEVIPREEREEEEYNQPAPPAPSNGECLLKPGITSKEYLDCLERKPVS